MSDSGNFIARWSRLKRRSGPRPLPSEPSPASETAAEIEAIPEAGPGTTTAVAPAFDVATLPPIGSIAAGTDIRPFLQVGVPAELTRSALRGAWAADPTIRDFIGIAENQWDFNDSAGILGFAPLSASGVAQGFIGGVPTALVSTPAAVVATSALLPPPPDRQFDPPREEHVDQVWLSGARSVERRPDISTAGQVSATGRPDVTVRHDPDTQTIRRRGHGSALPK
jgi:Protein of unknown function (DUF3306)